MKRYIYRGGLYEAEEHGGKFVHLKDDDEVYVVDANTTTEVKESDYRLFEKEYLAIKEGIRNIKQRLWRLDEEYHKKKNILHEMYMEQRGQQNNIISKLANMSRKGDEVAGKVD